MQGRKRQFGRNKRRGEGLEEILGDDGHNRVKVSLSQSSTSSCGTKYTIKPVDSDVKLSYATSREPDDIAWRNTIHRPNNLCQAQTVNILNIIIMLRQPQQS